MEKVNWDFMKTLRRIPEYDKGYVFFKRMLLKKVKEVAEKLTACSEQKQLLTNMISNSSIAPAYAERVRIDLEKLDKKVISLKDKLAYYGLANTITFDEYIGIQLFYLSWVMQRVIKGRIVMFTTADNVDLFKLKGHHYVYKPKVVKKTGQVFQTIDRVKTCKNLKALKEAGIQHKTKEHPEGQPFVVYKTGTDAYLNVILERSSPYMKDYYGSIIKYNNTRDSYFSGVKMFCDAMKSNPELITNLAVYERRDK